MRIAFYGSSLTSSYWNGAATYYRGIIRALAGLGYEVTFYEPDAYDRQKNRDIDPPPWCRVVVYPATIEGVQRVTACARHAEIVVKASGVGVFDDELLAAAMATARDDALRIFWDVDAPATLAELAANPGLPLKAKLKELDAVLTYGGGPKAVAAYQALGARLAQPIYNGLDPETHHPVPADQRYRAHLVFLGNRLPDREARVEEFFIAPARNAPKLSFLLGGAGWEGKNLPSNVRLLGHVPTRDHNALNSSAGAVLNINRASMAANGHSPATRVFEAAGAASCIITDAFAGIEAFLEPGEEVLVASNGQEVVGWLRALTPATAQAIGQRARARVLREHTYEQRAIEADALFRRLLRGKRSEAAA
jgi:spore maturation protein CgeB